MHSVYGIIYDCVEKYINNNNLILTNTIKNNLLFQPH